MDSQSDLLLQYNLKALKLPTFLRDFEKIARECTETKATFQEYLLKLTERELNERRTRATERRIRQARFPVRKTLESYDFKSMPSLNKHKVLQLARSGASLSKDVRTSSPWATAARARRILPRRWAWRRARRDTVSGSTRPQGL
jgi:DNA replication protein DnaC